MLNVIVIIVDALRARNTSCYGYSRPTTPFLERLAAESTQFQHAYTNAAWTIPAHASLLSGLYQRQHGLENIKGTRRFNEQIAPLPAILRRRGYKTVAFSQNPLFSPDYGFDFFDEHFHRELNAPARGKKGMARLGDVARRYWSKQKGLRSFLDEVQDWIRARGEDEPFFLLANVVPVHFPWAPPPRLLLSQLRGDLRYAANAEYFTPNPWRFNAGLLKMSPRHKRVWSALYDAATMHVDGELQRFVAGLKRSGKWENSVLVITADHGEMLGEPAEILGHTLTLHDNIMQVPLIVHHPDYPPGVKVEGVVQTLDLFASTLEWSGAGREGVPAAQLLRRSISEAVAQPAVRSGLAFAEEDFSGSHDVLRGLMRVNPKMDPRRYPRRQMAVHSGQHKYVWYDDRPAQLFDLALDPDERRDVAGRPGYEGVTGELVAALAAWQDDLPLFLPRTLAEAPEEDVEVRERLKALGYIE